jgi:hypothetical protein
MTDIIIKEEPKKSVREKRTAQKQEEYVLQPKVRSQI